jgi:hypothetical protein
MRLIIGLAAAILTVFSAAAGAQSVSVSSGPWFVGGGIGVGFGDVSYIDVSPFVGYQVNDKLSVGAGVLWQHRRDDRYSKTLTTDNYGANLFARYTVYGPLFLQGEYEYLDYEFYRTDLTTDRKTANSFFAGGGIAQPIGAKASLFFLAMYNLTYSSYDDPKPYDSPWVLRAGVSVGF